MSAVNPLPDLLPLSPEQAGLLEQLAVGLGESGLWWISGYAAGVARARANSANTANAAQAAAANSGALLPADAAPANPQRLTIVYASQTGNARRAAEQLAADAGAVGLETRLLRADACNARELKQEQLLYLVVSTQGDGDPSDDAQELYALLTGKRAPRLDHLHYAVLALGDSSYPQFCAVGRRLDERLEELGAHRLLARADADLDIDTVASPWRQQAVREAKERLDASAPARPSATVTPLRTASAPRFGREQPFPARVLCNQRLTVGSSKDVRHIELDLSGSGLQYEPGDALGVWPTNPPALVGAVLTRLQLDGDTEVAHGDERLPLRHWLTSRRELTRLARPFIAAHAAQAGSAPLEALLLPEQQAQLTRLLERTQVVDLLQQYPAAWTGEALVAALRPLAPRLYSIASSSKDVGDEAHLTVAHVDYLRDGQPRWGAASHLLATSGDDAQLPVFIEPNERFRLPADGSRDIIMVGPGTGVAPFRGFVQERAAVGASGRNWLLFGNPHFRSDFLYQLEWQRALKAGQLHRLDLAFSRDGAQKVYVQQRLRDAGADLHAWLQGGAHLYVCGSIAMGKDVHAALLAVVANQHGGDMDLATTYLQQLQREGRYSRDVY